MRRWFIFLVALSACAGSIVAALATRQQRDTNLRGYVDPIQVAELPYKVPHLGVNASLEQYTPVELDRQLAQMQAANITWVRQVIRWDDIQPERSTYKWEQVDQILGAFEHYPSLRPVIVLTGSPTWARAADVDSPGANTQYTPPTDPASFAMFAAAFAERYGEIVDHYQVWDEPNLITAWGGQNPNATAYAALLQASYTAIHDADPTATVISAAFAPTTETGPQNLNEWNYLEQLYALGISGFADAIGAKPYGFDAPPTDRTVELETLNVSRVVRLREIMVQNGDGDKAIWASNWGWNSLPADWRGVPSIWGQVSQEEQVNYTLEMLQRAEREWPWMAGMALHHWQPDAPPDDSIWGFALVNQQNKPNPLLSALQNLEPETHASNGLYPPTTQYAQYSGVWTFGELGADIGWLRDSRFTFDFRGSAVALRVREGDFVAYLYPTVDGKAPNELPRDADGNSYIILTSPSLMPQETLIPVSTDLSPDTHQLRAIADRGSDQWALTGFAVSDGDLAAPYNRQIMLAWLTAGIAFLGVMVAGWRIQWENVLAPLMRLRRLRRIFRWVLGVAASGLLLVGMLLTWGSGTPSLLRREHVSLALSMLTAGLIYIEPGLILTFIASVVLWWVVFNDLRAGLALILAWTPFFLFPVQLYTFAFPMAEVILLITFSAWMLQTAINWAERYKTRQPIEINLVPMDYGVLAWVLVAFLSLTWTNYLDPALTELRVLIVEPTLFYVMLRTYLQRDNSAQLMVDALLAGAMLMCLISVGMYLADAGVITAEGNARRLAGVYGSPNNAALYIGRIVPFALVYALLMPGRRLYGGFVLAVGLLTLALTQSVAGLFIGAPVGIALVLLLVYRRKVILPLAGLMLLAGVAFMLLAQFPRFGGVLDFSSGTNFRRIRVWQSGINVIADYPLTGLGLDQFLYAFRSKYILPDAWQEPDLSHPHNFLLDVWTRLGVLGVTVFAVLQVLFWRGIWRLYTRSAQQTTYWVVAVGCAGAMANLLAHGLVDNSIFVNDLAIVFALLLALSVSLHPQSEK